MGLDGRTPAAAAGIKIKGPSWMTLMENAALRERDKKRKENKDGSKTPAENAALREPLWRHDGGLDDIAHALGRYGIRRPPPGPLLAAPCVAGLPHGFASPPVRRAY